MKCERKCINIERTPRHQTSSLLAARGSKVLADDELMQRICEGDHNAFAELVARHTDQFYLLAMRTLGCRPDAEDVVQSAFVKLWQKPNSWDKKKSKFTTWFYRVVLNACHDFTRKHQRNLLMESPVMETLLPSEHSAETVLQERQTENRQQRWLAEAIEKLSKGQRDALNLIVYCELPQKEAAQVLGVSVSAIESLLRRARKSITDYCQSQHLEEQRGLATPPLALQESSL